MKNKAFTLIEIIGVIIILGLLVIIAVPFFTGSLNTFRDEYYINLENTVKTSGQEFFEDYEKLLPLNSLETQKVLISTLESEKYINDVLDYNSNKCDGDSFVRVINMGKEGYKYVTCVICPKDNYETMSVNDECNSWWDESTGNIISTIGEPEDVYIYKGATRDELEEKVKLKSDLVRVSPTGAVVGRVKGEGDSDKYLLPINIETVDLNKPGTYEIKYVNGNKTMTSKVVVYENNGPLVVFENVENDGTFNTNKKAIDLTPGRSEWAKALVITISQSGSSYAESGTEVASYQWNRGGRWKTFCEPADGVSCSVRISEEINKEKVKFRALDKSGNISLESREYELRVDNTKPKCELKAEGEQNTSGIFITKATVSFKTNTDLGYIQSGVKSYGLGSLTGSKSQTQQEDNLTGVKYTGYISDYADNISTCEVTVKQKTTYNLTYNNNGSSGCTSKNIVYKQAYGTLCTPNARVGYRYDGWYTLASGGTKVTESTVLDKDEDRTVFAIWIADNYTIIFNGNGNTGGSTATKTCTYDQDCTLTNNGFTKTGYTFAGWATESDGSVAYGNSATVKNLAASGTKTLYAKWNANTYTIAFNGNGNTGGSTASKTCTYDQNCTLTSNGFTKTGYTFAGWATSSGGGVAYGNSATVKNLATSGTKTLYAKWNANTYYISFNGNGNTGGSTATKTCTYDQNCTLTGNGFSKAGHTFAGWATSSGGSVAYGNSATVKNLATSGTKTLYAKWNIAVKEYSYTGGVQSFTIPATGTYKLEVWGAQGSAGGATGGNGGYAAGNKYLTAGQTIYIVVGGQGGYNGGGSGIHGGGTGGGATHMTTTNRGILSNYNSYRGEILIVAGGGGGGCNEERPLTGGSGGGTSGSNGQGRDGGIGGTQSAAGSRVSYCGTDDPAACGTSSGAFGRGGAAPEHAGENIGGGGAGYFGGSGGTGTDDNGAGGGGSGYIGGVSSGSMSNGARSGNGYARITFLQ